MKGIAAVWSAAAATASAACSSAQLATVAWTPLGAASPVSLRSAVHNNSACIQVSLTNQPNATWFALAIAKSSSMINSPPNNAILFTTHNASAALYVLEDAAPLGVHYEAHPASSCRVVDTAASNGEFTFTYERPLAATTAFDVPIKLNEPTTVNWAVGFSAFPDYHDIQGSAHVTFTDSSTPPALCSAALLEDVLPVQLNDGPMSIQSKVVDAATACIQVTLTNLPSATWFGLSFAPTPNMINSPTNNAIVFNIANHTANTVDLVQAAPDSVLPSANPSASYTIVHASTIGGTTTYVLERPLEATTATDIAISVEAPTIVNWAVGATAFPDFHDIQGSAELQFSPRGVVAVAPRAAPTTPVVAAVARLCDEAAVASTPSVRLGNGPLSIQSVLVGKSACVRVTSADPLLAWFGLSFAPTTNMINSPTNNAIVFQQRDVSVQVFNLHDSAPNAVVPHANSTASIRLLHVTSTPTQVSYFFERTIEAATDTDVALSTNDSVPTILNWAVGATAFPDYHDAQGSANLVFTTTHVWDYDHPFPPCNHAAFAAVSSVNLSVENNLSLKYVVHGPSVCVQVVLASPAATWLAVSIAPTSHMINSPTNNALVYLVHNASAHLFDLKDSAMDSVVFAATQTSVRVVSSSNVDGIVTVTFQRRLEAVGPTDVAISTTGPTILNWAIGFTTFPDYHDVQGSASISFGTPLSPPPCTKDVLNGSPVDLGPISLKSAVLGPFACFQVTVQYPNATWFALAIAPTTNMINTPANNAIVFHTTNGTAALYDLLDSAPDSVLYQPNQSSLRVIEASVVSGTVLVVFQRPLAATVPTDVAISTTEANIVNWAVGTTTWPDYHDIQGSATIRFSSISAVTTPASPAAPALVPTYTFWIAAATFILIASLGVVVTHSVGSSFRWAKHQRLTAPPSGAASIWSAFVRTLADITFGELVVVIIYLLAFVVVGISVRIQFPTVTAARAVALISGHTSLLSLTFMLLPVARGAHWEWLFGASHDRLIKLHRWLGRLFVLTATLHLAMNVPLITFAHSFGTQAVVPLFGFVAYVSFASMALLSYESIRRHYFEVFYYYHRIMSIVGLVFVVLHTEAVRTAMMLPLALYAATFVWRLRGYLNKYSARIQSSHVPNTVILVLPVTPQTKRWAATMNPCSFFWVNIPSVSVLQWHPFSAVVTPDGESIAFCMKSLAAGSFADQVVAQAKANLVSMAVFVGGPYGKPSVDFTKYDEVILIAGGIGVTPFVSLVNQLPHTLPAHANTHIQFHWIVRSAEELLAAETLMFAAPFPTFVTARYYVDGSHADGSIVATAGQSLQYSGGRPNLDEIVHADLYEGKTVCVLVCGPPGLTHSVQLRAYNARFDFHKEVFEY